MSRPSALEPLDAWKLIYVTEQRSKIFQNKNSSMKLRIIDKSMGLCLFYGPNSPIFRETRLPKRA